MKSVFVSIITLTLLLLASQGNAATRYWDGGGDGTNWSDPANWSGNVLPTGDDEIIINEQVGVLHLDISFELTGGSISLGREFGRPIFLFPSIFQIDNGVTLLNNRGWLNFDYGFVSNLGTITADGGSVVETMIVGGFLSNEGNIVDHRIEVGPEAILENSGTILTGSILTAIIGTSIREGSTVNNTGLLRNVHLTINADTVATNYGQITMQGDGGIDVTRGQGVFNNEGNILNRETIGNAGTFNNLDTIDNQSGIIENRCDPATLGIGVFNNSGTLLGNPVQSECIVWDNETGNDRWSDPLNWSDNRLPVPGDFVLVRPVNDAFTFVSMDQDFNVDNEMIVGDLVLLNVRNGRTLRNRGDIIIQAGSIWNDGQFINESNKIIEVSGFGTGSGNITNQNVFTNQGEIEFRFDTSFVNGSTASNLGSGEMHFEGGSRFSNGANFGNAGEVRMSCDVEYNNTGAVTGTRIIGLCTEWDGGGDGLRWSDPLNWSHNDVPGGTDHILIDAPAGLVRMDQSFTLNRSGRLTLGPAFGEPVLIVLPSLFQIDPGVLFVVEGARMDFNYGLVLNQGSISNPSNSLVAVMEVGSFLSNEGSFNNIRVEVKPDGTLDNLGSISRSSIITAITGEQVTGASHVTNRGLLDDTWLTINVGTTVENFDRIDMSGDGGIRLTSSLGELENHGDIINRESISNNGTIINFDTIDTAGGDFQNDGDLVSECGSTLIGPVSGNPPINVPCDVTPPVIATPGNLVAEASSGAGATVSYTVTANDDFDGPVAASCAPASGTTFGLGDTTVSCSATDAAGNSATASFLVSVVDTTPPALALPADIVTEATSSAGATVNYTVSATDTVDGAVAAFCSPASGATFSLGAHMANCSTSDAAGNTAAGSFSVNVVDTTPPDLSPPPDLVVEAAGPLTQVAIGSALATDFFLADVVNNAPARFPLGVTIVTWTASDTSGNTSTATQRVTVVDTTPPALVPPAAVSIEATGPLTAVDIGLATAVDLVDGPLPVSNDAPPAGFPVGITVVHWQAVDAAGNIAVATQAVEVTDTTPPVITPPGDIVVEANAVLSTVDIGIATAVDLVDGDVAVHNDAPAAGFPLGTTVVTWTSSDSRGNESSVTQQVTVIDTTPPELTLPDDITMLATGPLTAVDIGLATATDIFEPIAISHNAPALFPVGITEVTWRAVDANGNEATAVQVVHLQYRFDGFLSPLQPNKVYKSGRTVPVKFAIAYADGQPVDTASARLVLTLLIDGDVSGEPIEVSSRSAADTGDQFRYTGEHYQYNLDTRGIPGGLYRLQAVLDDDTAPFIDIGFK